MTNTIQIRTAHATGVEVAQDIRWIDSGEMTELTDESAVAIASWYQSPGAIGKVLAAFAGGVEVDRTELLDDISATVRYQARQERRAVVWPRELELLSTFVINYGKEI